MANSRRAGGLIVVAALAGFLLGAVALHRAQDAADAADEAQAQAEEAQDAASELSYRVDELENR